MTTPHQDATPQVGYMARDQYGETHHIDKHPRKFLLEYYDTQHADKMWSDTIDGEVKHVGYIVRGHWFAVYRVHEFKRAESCID